MSRKRQNQKRGNYNAEFARDMASDPNMGANPAWRRDNPNFKPGKFEVSYDKKKK